MPWSAWHQSPDTIPFSAWGEFVTTAVVDRYTYENGQPSGTWGEVLYSADRIDFGQFAALNTGPVDHTYGDDDLRSHYQVLLGPNNEDPAAALRPPVLPSDFDAVTEGNWAPIPGRPYPWFVEYESDRGAIQGWDFDGPPILVSQPNTKGTSATLEYLGESAYFTHGTGIGTSGYNLDDHPMYRFPHGTPVGTVLSSSPTGTPLPELADPGPLFGFAYTISTNSGEVGAQIAIAMPKPLPRVRYPRWRYWIESRPALQWKSRSDGRGMDGTPSWRRGRATTHAGQWRGTT